jgi:Mrp family chromosome partitioning ATPase
VAPSTKHPEPSALQLLVDLPGVSDIVWGTVTRLASTRAQTSVLFTAAEKGAGTSVVAAATAIGLARHERLPVCLLETNFRRPSLAGYLNLEHTGLSDVLDGRAELEDCLQEPRDCPGLLVLPAGSPREPVSGEFATDRLTSIIARLEARCHYLVLDAGPLLENVEARSLLRYADGALLVLRARVTRRSDAERAHEILVESGTPILGSIFNGYRSEGFLRGNGRAPRSFKRTERAERPSASAPPSTRGHEIDDDGISESPTNGGASPTNGGASPTNGDLVLETHAPNGQGTEATHASEIDILERRIAKLTHLLEQTEADLRRMAAMKNIDLGIASTSRDVRGLRAEDDAHAFKRSLMQKIFQANLELQAAMARPV